MRFSTVVAALVPIVAVSAQQTFTVVVGGNGSLTYDPTSVNASVGDTVAFQFAAKNHTVTQSTFAAPCQQMTTPTLGIDSGFMPVAANATSDPVWSFTVTNATSPLWFYCRQTGHCAQGMVFAVNPSATNTFAEFQAAAMSGSSNSTSSTSGSSSTSAASGTNTATGSQPSASATKANGAIKYSGSAATVLAIVGVAAGVLL